MSLRHLYDYGFCTKFINGIEFFLFKSFQKVVVDEFALLIAIIVSGVQQGTILGIDIIPYFHYINYTLCGIIKKTVICRWRVIGPQGTVLPFTAICFGH